MTPPTSGHLECDARPIGVIQPEHDRARRAIKAIAENRLDDALANIAALPDDDATDCVWKAILAGEVAALRKDFRTAIAQLEHAITACVVSAAGLIGVNPLSCPSLILRLAAVALDHLGRIHRRQDHPTAAFRTHVAAYRLRRDAGSFAELFDSALELGITRTLLNMAGETSDVGATTPSEHEGRHRTRMPLPFEQWLPVDPSVWTAETLFRHAIDLAEYATDGTARRSAIAWQRLAQCLTDSGRHDEAVVAARTAREFWRRHDISAVASARADMHLGRALLKLGESLFESDATGAASAIDEAVVSLSAANESLLAFGVEAAPDADSCAQQADFARRLRDTLNVDSSVV